MKPGSRKSLEAGAAEAAASPNRCPATPPGNSGAGEGPALRLVTIFVGVALCILTGCGTLARVSLYGDPETFHAQFSTFYPATDYDFIAISTGGRDWLAGHPESEATPSGWDLGLVVPLHILDLPISLVISLSTKVWGKEITILHGR